MINFKLKTVIILIAVTSITLQSCEKKELVDVNKESIINELTVNDMPQLETKEGMLYFDNSGEFFKTINVISNMTKKELDDWETKLGFISVRTVQNNFYDNLESFDKDFITENEVKDLVSDYKKYFRISTDEKGESEIIEKNGSELFASICNSNNMFIVGNEVTKIIEDYQISTSFENMKSILNADNEKIDILKNNPNFTVYQYTNYDNLKSNCGDISSKFTIVKDERWCRHDRRVRMQFGTNYIKSGSTYKYFSNFKVWGQKKISCIWCTYRTNLEVKNISYKVTYTKDRDSQTGEWIFDTYSKNISHMCENNTRKMVDIQVISIFYSAYQPDRPYFNRYKGSFTSRGVYGWGYGSCGF